MRRNGHKYGAVKTEVDGIVFASKAEAKRYVELKLLVRAKEISNLEMQLPFTLDAPLQPSGVKRIGVYVADFVYHDRKTGQDVIEDVKGFKTPLYRWKKKHVEAQHGITITEVGCATTATKAKRVLESRAKRKKDTHNTSPRPRP